MMDCCNQRCVKLAREVTQLREENSQQSEIIATLKTQLQNRDKEIERLSAMLEGGRPLSAIAKDCCFKDVDKRLSNLTNDVKQLEKTNKELDLQLRESVANQHEAMTRAVRLAERNKQLEQELRDIDHMALAVEAECNSTVKENTKRVTKIQEKLETSLMQIHDLEREILELKRSNQEQQAELHGCRKDKLNLQKTLDITLHEKKSLIDKMNNFSLIEHDLMVEIDRLTQANTLQKRRINELESRLLNKDTAAVVPDHLVNRKASPIKSKKGSKSSKNSNGDSRNGAHKGTVPAEREREEGLPLRELLERQREAYQGNGVRNELLDRIQAERDYYCKEYHNLKEQLGNIPDHPRPDNNLELRCKLNEKEQELVYLVQQIRDLTREKHNLQARIDAFNDREMRDSTTSPFCESAGLSFKAVMKRLERERDLARADIERLEEERDALRQRLKIATETQVAEHARLEKTVLESEERLRKLEVERRELLTSQGVHRATINNMEEQIDTCHDKLNSCQTELSQQRTLYNQIKALQEQTDRALADCQGHLTQSELELTNAQGRVRDLEKDRAALDREVASLKNERTVLRGNLAQVDQEKDGLLISVDNKTERIAVLEQELKTKENRVLNMESVITELQKKLNISLDEHGSREQAIRSAERNTEALRTEMAKLQRARDIALSDNRRLQDDLASVMQDCQAANGELGLAREEVETLKRQLQEYVTDIRRIEELLAQKESERGEMLEQFRGLSMEATVLETNNHSLESEAQENKTQLHMAQDRIVDLEQQLELRDTLVRSYENQIADLTTHIASLETQVQHHFDQKHQIEADLNAVRDLCVKLDSQKDSLVQQVTDGDVMRAHLENDLARLQEEQNLLQSHLSKDRATIDSLESMLADCRHETTEQRLLNQELQTEIQRLRRKGDELQNRLDSDAVELRRCQIQASEYSQQVSDLQRQLTNERFERARAADEHRRANESPPPRQTPEVEHQPRSPSAVSPPPVQARIGATFYRTQYVTHAPTARICMCPPESATTQCSNRRPHYKAPPPATDWGNRQARSPPSAPALKYPVADRATKCHPSAYTRPPASYHYTPPVGKTCAATAPPPARTPYAATAPPPTTTSAAGGPLPAPAPYGPYVHAPPLIINKNPAGEHTVHATFTSSGPPISSCTAQYTLVHHPTATVPTCATSTVVTSAISERTSSSTNNT